MYRGKHATACLNARRSSNRICIQVAPEHDQYLHVVTEYKHLGGIIAANASILPEMRQRTSSAMAAYGPIAMKVFGSSAIQDELKLHFVRALILSRLLYNVHTLVMIPVGLRRLNAVYIRVLRRIADDPRYSTKVLHNDREIRILLDMPFIDALVLQKRFKYYQRLTTRMLEALVTLLQSQVGAKRLPWIDQLYKDLLAPHALSHQVRGKLPQRMDNTPRAPRFDLMRETPDYWNEMIGAIAYVESCIDSGPFHEHDETMHACLCMQCMYCATGLFFSKGIGSTPTD